MGTACFVAFFTGGALAGLTGESRFEEKNEMLTTFRPTHVPGRRVTVGCGPELRPLEIKPRFVDVWKNAESRRYCSRLLQLLCSSISFLSWSLLQGSSVWLRGISMIVYCLTWCVSHGGYCILDSNCMFIGVDELLTHIDVCAPSSGGRWDGFKVTVRLSFAFCFPVVLTIGRSVLMELQPVFQ